MLGIHDRQLPGVRLGADIDRHGPASGHLDRPSSACTVCIFQPVAQTPARAPVSEDLGLSSDKYPIYGGRAGLRAFLCGRLIYAWQPYMATPASAADRVSWMAMESAPCQSCMPRGSITPGGEADRGSWRSG